MINILIITHGKLGEELVRGAEMIIGHHVEVSTFHIPPDESQESLRDKVGTVINGIDKGDGIIVLTDMLGGTPCNIVLPYTKKYNMEIVSGVNLYMLIAALINRDKMPLKDLAKKVVDVGRKNIMDVKEIFLGKINTKA
ncbi:MAG: hypothetical protein A3J83_01475 [Elusimicrobia bacterium RIFOXYA2_FULL_40_6]|nr:MAG: hypothetical protein A3J83_01475 [Elusimicrobia bacterium RIFOXYA2_FULL_40_6]